MKAEAEVAALLEDDPPAPGDDVAGEAGAGDQRRKQLGMTWEEALKEAGRAS